MAKDLVSSASVSGTRWGIVDRCL